VNVTNSPGYDNQPSFTPDGRQILFTSIRGGATQTDIYAYDLTGKNTVRLTATAEGEYSPTVTPDGRHFSVIRVEADATQRLWRFTLEGRDPEVVLRDVKPVGYHAWADERTLVLFVLGDPATLQIADAQTGKADVVGRGIGRSIQRVPGRGTTSVVARDAPAQQGGVPVLHIRELDPKSRAMTPLIDAPAGATEADVAWTPSGVLLVASKDILYGWQRGDSEWRRIADLGALGLRGVTRLNVSPNGTQIAIVAQPR
jgi:dipeptidyl aminopeptidase/acylaminoacyl peptidase